MNETLEQDTVEELEELNNYKLVFENNSISNQILSETIDSDDEAKTVQSENLEDLDQECTALVTLKERRLLAAQTMFKKSIKVSIKSFLISLSLSFLNLFI